MGSSGILDFRKFSLFLCLTSVLTSSVSDGTHGTSTNNLKISENDREPNGALKADVRSFNLPSSTAVNIVEAEGGPIPVQTTILNGTSKNVTGNKNSETIASVEEKTSKEQNIKFPDIPPKKVSKIVPRKGAKPSSIEHLKETNPTIKPSTQIDIVRSSEEEKELKLNTQIKNTPSIRSNSTSENEENTVSTASMEKVTIGATSKIPPTTKKHKPKPTVTIGESGIDKPIPASPTKSPPLGMPRKIDYIVPVVVTIVPLPFVAIAAFILYRRGRDCWDKRHYRRMDFLIDGGKICSL